MRPKRLSAIEVQEGLRDLPGWGFDEFKLALFKRFVFDNFSEAWRFMASVAETAEKMDHHPDWSNSYNKVDVRLKTHDQGGVTQLDFEMAKAMNTLSRD